MYDQFYGLRGLPFQLTPDPHFYFESSTHRKALSYLGYGLAQGEGFIVITGDIGAGKTTLVGHLMATIDPSRLTAVKIVSTQIGCDDMLRLAAQNFGIPSEGVAKADLLRKIEQFLHNQARQGLRTLLIVDEAQNLPVASIEELRMLSNFQLGGQALLQIFLLGQPEFRDKLYSPQLEQLRQRVIATHHLEPMMPGEIEPYIAHRMQLVGWSGNPRFTADAYGAIYQATGGVPRRVNALMSRVLLMGAVEHLSVIDGAVVESVASEMGLEARPFPMEPKPASVMAAEDASSIEPSPDASAEPMAEEPVAAAPVAADPVMPEPVMTEPVCSPFAASEPEAATPPSFMPSEQELQLEVPVEPAYVETVAVPQPVIEATETAKVLDDGGLAPLRGDIASLKEALANVQSSGKAVAALEQRLSDIEQRLAAAETRGEQQEVALRRVLTMLVRWMETDQPAARAS